MGRDLDAIREKLDSLEKSKEQKKEEKKPRTPKKTENLNQKKKIVLKSKYIQRIAETEEQPETPDTIPKSTIFKNSLGLLSKERIILRLFYQCRMF